MVSIKDRVRNLDGHSSVSNEFRVYTIQGAVLSVITLCTILYLATTELYYNFQITKKVTVHVNATSSRGLEMEFDITLPAVPCNKLSIDANDVHGQSQSLHLDTKHHIWKHRIKFSPDGFTKQYIGHKSKLELGSTLLKEKDLVVLAEKDGKIVERKLSEEYDDDYALEDGHSQRKSKKDGKEDEADDDYEDSIHKKHTKAGKKKANNEEVCGSCYGAGDEGECCDTCEDVKRVYKRKGWLLRDLHTIAVCKEEAEKEAASAFPPQDGEGCNVHGKVALSTGGGNLHLAPGRETIQTGVSILDVLLQSFQEWNVTHTIHKIRFGPDHPNAINQIDGITQQITDTYGMYQYYFQIVPTTYKFHNGTILHTNQYSVMSHLRHITPGSNRGLPGVFFFYEVSPLHVDIEEGYHQGWVAFFTSVCAIIGGVVTVMGLLDQFLFSFLAGDTSTGLMK